MTSPDAVDRRDLLDRRGGDLVDRSERVGERARRRRADVADAEAVQQPIDRAILRGGDRRLQVRDGAVLEVRQLADLLVGQGEDVGLIGDQPLLEQLLRGALAQVLDVHRAAAREVDDAPPDLGRALQVRAARDRLALGADDRRPAVGAVAGITNLRSPPLRRLGIGATTSGITSPARRTTTVSPISTPLRSTSSALCSVAIEIGHAADAHRLEHRERGDRAGAPDADLDVAQDGGLLLGRELVGDRPARKLRGRAELVRVGRSDRP